MSSTQTKPTNAADLEAVAEAIRGHDRFIVTTHENPDGDALGSLVAMTLALLVLVSVSAIAVVISDETWRCASLMRASPMITAVAASAS